MWRCVIAALGRSSCSLPLAQASGVPTVAPQLTSALAELRHTFVVADATLPDCPLIYASEG